MEDLIVRFCIKEDHRGNKRLVPTGGAKANVMEHGQDSKPKQNKTKLWAKVGISKNKFQGNCFNYGKKGHRFIECHLPKGKKPEENLVRFNAKE